MKNTLVLIAILISTFMMQSCDSRKSLGKSQYEQKIEDESKGAIKIRDFKRIDAMEGALAGVSYYAVQFETTLEFEKNSWKKGSRTLQSFVVTDTQTPDWVYGVDAYFNKGDKIFIKGTLNFVKMESGWKIDNIVVESQKTL
jgi:hypothetical protein